MWVLLFLLLFFGLLASGMPIFLVLGICAAVLFGVSDQPLARLWRKVRCDQRRASPTGCGAAGKLTRLAAAAGDSRWTCQLLPLLNVKPTDTFFA